MPEITEETEERAEEETGSGRARGPTGEGLFKSKGLNGGELDFLERCSEEFCRKCGVSSLQELRSKEESQYLT